jgi:hypothetical protein
VDLRKRLDGHPALNSSHGDRSPETVATAAFAEQPMVNIVDFLHRWSRTAEPGPPPVLKEAVKGNMHGRESGNVELRPYC